MCCVPPVPSVLLTYLYQTYSIVLTVPLNITAVPLSGELVKVGEPYEISCVVTGDEAPTDNPWLHSDKTVKDDTKAGVKVTTVHVTLPNTKGINSTITFTKVTKEQLGDYICSAGDDKRLATVTLKEAGKWNVQFGFILLHIAESCVVYMQNYMYRHRNLYVFVSTKFVFAHNFTSRHLKFIQASSDFN